MNWIRARRPSPATVIALAALIVALGGVAYATIPDSNGTIHGCYQKNSGALRVVESSGDCRNGESAVAWNRQGPSGGGGSNIVARARSTASVATTINLPNSDADGPGTVIPLADDSWTQGPGEINDFYGEVTYTKVPGSCEFGAGIVIVKVGDRIVLTGSLGQQKPDGTYTQRIRPFDSLDFLFESNGSVQRTVTAEAWQTLCDSGPRFRIDSLNVDVVAFR